MHQEKNPDQLGEKSQRETLTLSYKQDVALSPYLWQSNKNSN